MRLGIWLCLSILLFACGASKTATPEVDVIADVRSDVGKSNHVADLRTTGCKPGSTQCQGNAVAQCNAEGTAWGTTATCPAGEKCAEGACICEPNCAKKQCGDDGCGGSCGECGDGEACQGGSCVCLPNCTGKACGDDGCGGSCGQCSDGDACLGPQECQAGACKPGVPVVCNDDDPCTTDDCDPVSGCQHTGHAGECDDGNPCTQATTCVGGICTGGEKLVCDDGNPCTTDACSSVEGCIVVYNSKPCDDSDPCTEGDVCQEGVCTSGDNVCFPCQSNDDCLDLDDGNLCNGLMGCVEGLCTSLPESQVVCEDLPDDCITSSCNGQTGLCEDQPLPDMTYCNDGGLCTVDDVCKAGVCTGDPVSCNDGDECTTDWCDDGAGCLHDSLCPAEAMCLTDGSCCFPLACGKPGMECGDRDSGCGDVVDCGNCPEGEECKNGVCSDGICTAELVSHTYRGGTWDIAVEGDVAALAMGLGVWFLDTSQPESPALFSKYETVAPAGTISVSEGLAATGGWPGKLEFVDFNDPLVPVSLGVLDLSAEFGWGAHFPEYDISGEWMAMGRSDEVLVLDVSGFPVIETVASHTVQGSAIELAIDDGWLFAASRLEDAQQCLLYSFPLTSSSATPVTPVAELECSALDDVAAEDGRLVLLASSESGSVHLYDVNKPDTPEHTVTMSAGKSPSEVRLTDSVACLVHDQYCCGPQEQYALATVLDIDDLWQPEVLWTAFVDNKGSSVCHLVADVAYSLHSSQGLTLYDLGSPPEPTPLPHSLFMPGRYGKAVLSDSHLIAASSTNGLEIYSLGPGGQSLNPETWLDVTDDPQPVAVHRDGTAYISADMGVKKVDIANLHSPYLIGATLFNSQKGWFDDLAVPGDGLGYGIGRFGEGIESTRRLVVFDEESLEPVSEVVLPETIASSNRLLVHGSVVFVTSDGMATIDMSDPSVPVVTEIEDWELYSGSWGFALAGNWLYAAGEVAVHVWDVSPSLAPVYLASSDFVATAGVVAEAEGYLFVAGWGPSFGILSLVEPTAPQIVEYVDVPGAIDDRGHVDVSSGYAAVTTWGNVEIYDISGCW